MAIVKKTRASVEVGGVEKQSHGKQYEGSTKKIIELTYDPAIPLLGLFPKEPR